jgi:hypothetical protein
MKVDMFVLVDVDFEQDAAYLSGDKGLCFYVASVHFVHDFGFST